MKRLYALTNPISMILDKPAEEFTRADLIRVIEEKTSNGSPFTKPLSTAS